jgi:hypothetical protein
LAIVAFSILAFIAAISGGFKQLLILATLSVLLLHLGVALAVIKFRVKPGAENQGKFRLPGGIGIPLVAAVVLLWFIFQSKTNEVSSVLIFCVLLSGLYVLRAFIFKRS